MRLTDLGMGIWVGDRVACDLICKGEAGPKQGFSRIIHIYKANDFPVCEACRARATGERLSKSGEGDHVTQPEFLNVTDPGRPDDLFLNYREGKPLNTMPILPAELVRWFQRPGTVMVHCAGGACRGPTLATLALIARGMRPHAAFRHVMTGIWDGYGVPFSMHSEVVGSIFALAGLPAPWDAPPTMQGWP